MNLVNTVKLWELFCCLVSSCLFLKSTEILASCSRAQVPLSVWGQRQYSVCACYTGGVGTINFRCRYIILFSRISDIMIPQLSGIIWKFTPYLPTAYPSRWQWSSITTSVNQTLCLENMMFQHYEILKKIVWFFFPKFLPFFWIL